MDQDPLPFFDELDDIEESNKISWFLSHRFTARNSMTDKHGNPVNTYRELGWVKFFQDYSLLDEHDGIDTETGTGRIFIWTYGCIRSRFCP